MNDLYHLPQSRTRAASLYPAVCLGMVCVTVTALAVGSQTAAHKWGYARVLGEPVWGKLYIPGQFIVWAIKYHLDPFANPVIWASVKMFSLTFFAGLVLVIGNAVRRAKQVGGKSDLYGSAEFGTWEHLKEAGLLSGKGLFIGMWEKKNWRGKTVLFAIQDDGPEPLLVVGPNRSGKGVGPVITNLLYWPESLVVLDPRGENWQNSAGYRTTQGYRCLKIDPTCTNGRNTRWNPLLEMPGPPYDVGFAQTIAQALMESEEFTKSDETAQHFRNTAEDFLRGLILHVCHAEEEKSLERCLQLVTDPERPLDETLKDIRTTTTHPVVAASMRAVENKSPNERTSVISTAIAFLNIYRDPIVALNTKASDFFVRDLIDASKSPLSLYITIPTPDMARLKPYVRILFYQILHTLTMRLRAPSLGWATRESAARRVLLLLDEFPILGNMRKFHDTISVLAGYGVKVMLLTQGINHIYGAYGEKEKITDNCKIQVVFAPNRYDTAKWVSDKTGTQTVYKRQDTYTGSRFSWLLPHVIRSEQEVERKLVNPDEASRLPDDTQLLLLSGQTFLTKKIRFYQIPEMTVKAAIPPPVHTQREFSHAKKEAEENTPGSDWLEALS